MGLDLIRASHLQGAVMNYAQIKKLADQLGLEVEKNDLTWDEWDGWTLFVDAPIGKSFGCQHHAASFVFPDDEKKYTKTQVWDFVAEFMKSEATELSDCDCGHWDDHYKEMASQGICIYPIPQSDFYFVP